MNYIGRKYSLLEFLETEILKRIPKTCKVFFDVFAGTGVVGWHFKQRGFRIVANDIQYYAYCLNRALVCVNRLPGFVRLSSNPRRPAAERLNAVLESLNRLPGQEGFVFNHYCQGGQAASGRMYFSDDNGRRCDTVRSTIEAWWIQGKLSRSEYYYLLACLIDAMDRVANTASVYAAYLKHIKKSARKPLWLTPLPIVPSSERHRVHNRDGLRLVGRVPCDVLYMDPPYNHRQYCTNYHVLETIARNDSPKIYGVTGLRPYEDQKSAFSLKRQALGALDTMVAKTRARFVFLSYNSEGIIGKETILDALFKYGPVDLVTRDYGRFRADVDRENRVYKADRVEEYLFCLQKHG